MSERRSRAAEASRAERGFAERKLGRRDAASAFFGGGPRSVAAVTGDHEESRTSV